jgi:hypothetical protein
LRARLIHEALAVAPRILGLGDRDPASATYGCWHRGHWRYLTADFPCAWFQAAAWYLARLYVAPGGTNRFAGQEAVRDWTRAAVDYTLKIRHRDGSLDEAYPFERGFCVTAFGLAWTGSARLLLGERDGADLARTGRWLVRHPPVEASNQTAAAAAGLATLARLTGENRWRAGAETMVERLLAAQDAAGFFPEYGRPDLGYLSLTLALLDEIFIQWPDRVLQEALTRAGAFLEERVGEHGRLDPAWSGRGTQYLFPSGLIRWAPGALAKLLAGLEAGEAVRPSWLDDRYVIPLAADYLAAAEKVLA